MATPPAGRYGRSPARTPGSAPTTRAKVGLWALGVAAVAVAVWLGLVAARSPVTWDDVGFTVQGADGVEVVFDVNRADPSVPVQCRLQALNQQFAQVGVLVVDIAPSTDAQQRFRSTVATAEPAVTGVVESCWVR